MANSASTPSNDHPDHLQQQLQESIEQYQLVAKATNDAMYDLNLRRATVSWNDALYSQYGHNAAEPVTTMEWWTQHIHPDDAIRIENELMHWLTSGENNWHSEYRFQRGDGSYAVVRDRAFVQRDAGGEPLRIIGSLLDITREKELERAKDEFISLVSHQLRTPLTIIRLSGEILANGMAGPLNEAQHAYATHVADASVRLIRLVSNILNISRVELDRITIDPAPTDVHKLLQSHIDELMPLVKDRDITIRFAHRAKLSPLSLDTTVFGQIIVNILTNAINYTEPHRGRIIVRLTRDKEGYVVSVSDNGIGIPRIAKKRIFERFYRAPNTTHVEGTGLGLYLSQLLATSFGGTLWFESTLHKGSTFYLRIPEGGMSPRLGDWGLDQ